MREVEETKRDNDWEEFVKARRFDRGVLESLLFCSKTDEKYEFPTIEQFILGEVVNATIEFIGGKVDLNKTDYKLNRFDFRLFESELTEYFQEQINIHKSKNLSPNIQNSIVSLTSAYRVSPSGPDRPYFHTNLYTEFSISPIPLFTNYICNSRFQSIFTLDDKTNQIAQKFLKQLPEKEKQNITEISKIMRKYIEGDLKYIRKTYHW